MKILVTGGAGYIGSAITKSLVDAGMFVVVYDDLSEGDRTKVDPQAVFVHGDVTDAVALEAVFATYSFDAVVHCAAKKVMFESEVNPSKYFINNVGGTTVVLSLMEKYGVPKIIFSSTAAVYAPVVDGRPVTETDALDPQSVYGRSKHICEMLIAEYARLGKIKEYVIFRYFNVAGDIGLLFKEQNPQGVFPHLARSIKNNEPFQIFGTQYPTRDGSAIRDYIHLSDLAQAHVLALTQSAGGNVFNLGTSTGHTVRELVDAFREVTGKDILVVEADARQGDIAIMLADASKARTVLGWEPSHSLLDSVRSVVQSFEL